MKITSSLVKPGKSTADAIIVGAFSDKTHNAIMQEVDQLLNGQVSKLHKSQDFKATSTEVLTLFSSNGQRIVLVGLGEKNKCNLSTLQKVTTNAIKALVATPVKSVSNYLTAINFHNIDSAMADKIICLAASHAVYRYNTTKVFKQDNKHSLDSMDVYSKNRQNIQQAAAIAEGIKTTRELGNLPANICNPKYLADIAKNISKQYENCSVTILNYKQMKALKMGSLLAVARGSRNKPKMIVLKYKGANKNQQPHILVGKGITFDTGGISLKPSANMDEMKYDMCGAAAVIGTFVAVAEMQLAINLICIVPAVENMPDGDAYRPGDVVTSYSGKTIEVINTDAEGRMILCDALTYAQEYKPQVLIDVATLTGSCVVALGHVASAVMSKQTQLPQDIINAGTEIYDIVWQMPLWDEYQKQMDSHYADMRNAGGPIAGAITAGCFLSRFTKGANWAHVDIAGSAWSNAKEGATGRPVAMLAQYLINESNK
ncbi:Cytosol aminopeptidase PepA [hydrothermal vent metagenome]|uniref:leucyl aminopeptidase n=1 Tax=hydrothermal vent metagenome TaxID=652676 RepID=A0A3B0WAX2_9ZZZZ